MKKTDIVTIISAKHANPNGDPDADNEPRVDSETGKGIMTPGSIKRKIRNYILQKYGEEPGYDIYIKENTVLAETKIKTLEDANINTKNPEKEKVGAKEAMCKTFFDVRAFGAVMSTNQANCGQVRGPVQVTMFESIDPVNVLDIAITRCAGETTKEKEKSLDGKSKTMGSFKAVSFAAYKGLISVNPVLAKETGFSDLDLERLIDAAKNLFTLDGSTARPTGSMAVESMIVFEHEKEYGNEQTAKLFRKVTVEKSQETPSRMEDYTINIDQNIPQGIEVKTLI